MFGFGKQPIERLHFIVIGAQKAGTTALNYYLKRHPGIALPEKKELHFFDNDDFFQDNDRNYQRLHAKFKPARRNVIAGENTPNYLYWPTAIPRIHTYNPAMKLIAILRNPIERAYSQWNMQRSRGIEPLPFLEAITQEDGRLKQLPPAQKRKFAYVDRGRYFAQLQRVFALFPRQQVHVVRYEQFRLHQRQTIEEIYTFLGLANPPRFKAVEAHGIPYAEKALEEAKAKVRVLLESDITQLEALLGWDCTNWR